MEPTHGPMQNTTALLLFRKESQIVTGDCSGVVCSTWLDDAMFLSIVMLVRVTILREGPSLQGCVIGDCGIEQVQQRLAYMIYLTAL
jgi:hypothetical protein